MKPKYLNAAVLQFRSQCLYSCAQVKQVIVMCHNITWYKEPSPKFWVNHKPTVTQDIDVSEIMFAFDVLLLQLHTQPIETSEATGTDGFMPAWQTGDIMGSRPLHVLPKLTTNMK